MSESDLRIVIIGSGNVATHLARGLHASGASIVQIISPTPGHADRLAREFDEADAADSLSDIVTDADLYLIAAKDDSIAGIARSLPRLNGLVAHTSGSVPLDALASVSDSTAVLYPLQTFTREAEVRLSEVPFFTEASDSSTLAVIDRIAMRISDQVYHADSEKRKILHLAGVFSCNFVNYLWDCTSEILAAGGYKFDVVAPLVKATLEKAIALGPHNSQTGPAMRCDKDIINRQIEGLDHDKQTIYRQLTLAIIKSHNLDCNIYE